MKLDRSIADRFAKIALGHVGQEFPHKLDHVLGSGADALPPRALHPIFFGSFDWHSCVHGWWTLLTLRRLFPDMVEAQRIAALADGSFTAAKVGAELAYLGRPLSRGFERPYGWAWLLALQHEAERHTDRDWGRVLAPLAEAFGRRFEDYLTLLTYPIRVGTHFNTAFAMVLAYDWAKANSNSLPALIRASAAWFSDDRDCQAWEPGGDEFLSSALTEALFMSQVLAAPNFKRWFAAFLPRLSEREPRTLFTPAVVSDRSDGKIAHLDGLNLSRAWCWRNLAPLLPPDQAKLAQEAAAAHLEAAMPHVAGDYMGEHWLATFALLALLAPSGT